MSSDSNRSFLPPFQAQAELELLHDILQGVETSPYPWNPMEAETTAYFEALEQEVIALGWTDADYAPYVGALSQQLDQAWAELQPASASSLAQFFSGELFHNLTQRIPHRFLETIVQRAQQSVAHNLSMTDQLVMCVQEFLPEWGAEDLAVFARPFAYAMRGPAEENVVEGALQSIRPVAWEELSSIEQARLSLAIARYAIAQLPESES
ncbi:MAG TPA: hypothetical protein IGS37_10790 [Synechococcales cyanobacterium M55_K2018_004]|nr:hypothetical protein [Synechococcales cyanobacterium M55_K2018_004]